MSVGVMTVGVMSVGEITVGVMTVGVIRRPRVFLERRQSGISLCSLVMDTSSLSILCIIISLASFLLSAKGLHLSLWSMLLTLDWFPWLLTTYLAALLCTASILFISVFV